MQIQNTTINEANCEILRLKEAYKLKYYDDESLHTRSARFNISESSPPPTLKKRFDLRNIVKKRTQLPQNNEEIGGK
jgi:hypothetical protein